MKNTLKKLSILLAISLFVFAFATACGEPQKRT